MKLRVRFYITISLLMSAGFSLAALGSPGHLVRGLADIKGCCQVPNTEYPSYVGDGSLTGADNTLSLWTMSISGPAGSYDGWEVAEEGTAVSPDDTCYWTYRADEGADPPGITGPLGLTSSFADPWTVSSGQWGYDYMGWSNASVSNYRSVLNPHGQLPCSTTVQQAMWIYCQFGFVPALQPYSWQEYTWNYTTQTQTYNLLVDSIVDNSHVQTCRTEFDYPQRCGTLIPH
jgi:hypothetical protein